MSTKLRRLLVDKELRNKYILDQIKIGLRYQIKAIRDEQNITQAELATMIGTKQSVISRIEKHPLSVGFSTYLKISIALDVALVVRFEAIDTFMDWYDNMTPKKMCPSPSADILETKKPRPGAEAEC